ncbi:DNA polymerase III subunit epsilon [Celeribacter indicus]|uniref:DNA polymerase III subunit epsilon n=1 Tax=Celeribacter indicus TaxID=1208324 RepID=A0A0B5DNY1_9RHOB|nr:DNA polymerase III subunit epsilon [Celeribacter indicus]AJE44919.1 DNA polymerase III subunit epsilon [Celeribacter indicus]SDW97259.1 DNA polymerase-3 subunit epsilon [Celeribacter indicus]
MREIVLDTETTGFDPFSGDRLVEIGAIELVNHMPTGRTYHQYIHPDRFMPDEAFGVHGIGCDLLQNPRPPREGEVILKDKPFFKAVGQAFLDFIGTDSKLVIHNASFDMKFLNAELKWIGLPEIPFVRAVDTLAMARQKFPGSPATLDALCRRFNIDNSARTLHGALLDSEILAEVYLELIGGRQPDLVLAPVKSGTSGTSAASAENWRPTRRPAPLPPRITEEEAAAHAAFVETLGDGAIWKKYSEA